MKLAPFLTFTLLFLVLGACSTPREFAAPSSGWNTYQGQLRYSGDGNPVIGEVIVRTGADHNLEAQFLSGPGFPLMRVRSDASAALAEGAIARGRWQGPVEKSPTRIVGWFVLYDAFDKAAKQSGILQGEGWTAQATHQGGRLKTLDIRVPASGERFQFSLGG